jgi:hypothetical protein
MRRAVDKVGPCTLGDNEIDGEGESRRNQSISCHDSGE